MRDSATTTRMLAWCSGVLRGSSNPDTVPTAEHHATAFDRATERALLSTSPVSVLLVSIDYFDIVISHHGQEVASEIRSIVAGRIGDVVRLGDAMNEHDDGFLILWVPDPGAPDVTEIAARIANQFNEPVMCSAGQLPITVSVGIASSAALGLRKTTAGALRRQARSAVLAAQRGGRSKLAVYDRTIQQHAAASYETERHLRAALQNERLTVDYQPIVSLHSGETFGIEALARWNDDALGSVGPTTFIPIAEESGLIKELGARILQTAVAQASQWNTQDQHRFLMAINISNRELLDPDLIPTIDRLLTQYDVDPRFLCLEISESVVMSDVAMSMTVLGHLKDRGLCLAIDDFGTGYSSLSYLRRLPVDILKIDQSFVQSIYNRDDRVITKAIIDLAHTLGMMTVAEGVETRLQVEVLHALNCDMAQGFYLHEPTRADLVDVSPIDFEKPRLGETDPALPVSSGQFLHRY